MEKKVEVTTRDDLVDKVVAHIRAKGKAEPLISCPLNQRPDWCSMFITIKGEGCRYFYGNTAQEVLDDVRKAY